MAKKLFNSADAAAPEPQDAKVLPCKGALTVGKWLGRIKSAQRNIEDLQPLWDKNQRRYLNKKRDADRDGERKMLVPSLYWHTEEKKAWLMPATPKVSVTAKRSDCVQAAPLVEAIINDVLTADEPDGVGAMTALEEVMSDMLIGSGIFAVNIGYENVIDGTKIIGEDGSLGMQPDPNWIPPDPATLDPTQPPPQAPQVPITMEVPNVVTETYYMNRLETSKLLIPDDFKGSDYDKAAWLGFEFLIDEFLGRLKWKNIPDDYEQYADGDDRLMNAHDREHARQDDKRKKFRGWCMFYKAAIFDPSVKNKYQQRMIVILEGLKKPVEHKNSPFQWEDEDGKLCGMMGFPIHIGALRYVSDSAFPPSDATMSEYQDTEITDGRNDMKLQRERNIPLRVANVTRLKQGGIDRIERAPYGSIIPLDETAFGENGQMPIKDVQTFAYPPENYQFNNINNQDMDKVYGTGASSGGALPSGQVSASAAASNFAERAAQSRRDREQAKFMAWYAGAIGKLFPLYQRYMTETQYVEMLGPNDAKVLTDWNKEKIQGKFAFKVLPKASPAAAQERQDELNWYQLVAKSPNTNLRALDEELAKSFGKDPARIIKPIAPPPPPPPQLPKGITLNLDEKGLNPLGPAFPIIVSLLRASGVAIDDQTIAQAQHQAMKTGLPPAAAGNVADGQVPPPPPPAPPAPGPPPQHGGAADKVQPIDKNMLTDNPGGMPGRTAA